MLTNMHGPIALSIMKNEVRVHGKVNVRVQGISMMPTLIAEDIVTVTSPKQYKAGDIIVFMAHYEKMVVHRIISIDQGHFVTKGDNNNFYDEKFDVSTIVGKVDFWIRNGEKMYFSDNFILTKILICISRIEVKYPSEKFLTSLKNYLLSIGTKRDTMCRA